MAKYVEGIEFVTEECCACGMPFAMTVDFQKRRLQDHKFFFCPRGHSQHYIGKTEEQKLRDQLAQEQRRTTSAQAEAVRLRKQKKVQEALKNHLKTRINNGVCPCCNRYFENLHRHMQNKHHDYLEKPEHKLTELRRAQKLTQVEIADMIGVSSSYISNFERGKYTPEGALEEIHAWIEVNL